MFFYRLINNIKIYMKTNNNKSNDCWDNILQFDEYYKKVSSKLDSNQDWIDRLYEEIDRVNSINATLTDIGDLNNNIKDLSKENTKLLSFQKEIYNNVVKEMELLLDINSDISAQELEINLRKNNTSIYLTSREMTNENLKYDCQWNGKKKNRELYITMTTKKGSYLKRLFKFKIKNEIQNLELLNDAGWLTVYE